MNGATSAAVAAAASPTFPRRVFHGRDPVTHSQIIPGSDKATAT